MVHKESAVRLSSFDGGFEKVAFVVNFLVKGKDVVLQGDFGATFVAADGIYGFLDHFGIALLSLWRQLDAVFVVVVHKESAVCLSSFDGAAEKAAFVVHFLVRGKDVVLQGNLGATFIAADKLYRFVDHFGVSLLRF